MQYTYYGKGGNQQTSIYPKNNRPFNNNDTNGVLGSSFGKPIPIKHWRKQLHTYYDTTSNQISIDTVNNPNVINTTLDIDDTECSNIVEQVISTSTCNGIKNNGICIGGTSNIRRSASTILPRNYCSSTRQYLQKRCKTFEQNAMIGKPIDINKNLFNTTINPNNDSKSKCVVYKQNNPSFSTIDAVVSSNYVSKKKNNAINKNPYKPNKKLEQQCSAGCIVSNKI
jgi:hypothetical protein